MDASVGNLKVEYRSINTNRALPKDQVHVVVATTSSKADSDSDCRHCDGSEQYSAVLSTLARLLGPALQKTLIFNVACCIENTPSQDSVSVDALKCGNRVP